MSKLFIVALVLILSGCATFKVERTEIVGAGAPVVDASLPIKVELIGPRFGGGHCYEAMFFVLTLGVIPTHCVDNYRAAISAESGQGQEIPLGTFRITTMSGWFALLLAPLPQWRFGSPDTPEVEIKRSITEK